MRVLLNAILFLAVLALIAANLVLRPDPARPNYEFLPQMAHAPRYNAFSPNPNFANGETLQTPPAGAIARGLMPLHYAATPQDALRAGEELKSPINLTSQQARDRGAAVFANYCAVCHGAAGAGNGPVTQRGFPPPPPLTAERALKMKDGQLFHILTFGQNNMPSYASQLSRTDRWNAIAYIRVLQAAATTTPAAQPAGAKPTMPVPQAPHPGKTAAISTKDSAGGPTMLLAQQQQDPGAVLFNANCAPCHGENGAGSGNSQGPPSLLSAHAAALTEPQLASFMSSGRGEMPGFSGQLSLEDCRRIAAYIRKLQHGPRLAPPTPPVSLQASADTRGGQ